MNDDFFPLHMIVCTMIHESVNKMYYIYNHVILPYTHGHYKTFYYCNNAVLLSIYILTTIYTSHTYALHYMYIFQSSKESEHTTEDHYVEKDEVSPNDLPDSWAHAHQAIDISAGKAEVLPEVHVLQPIDKLSPTCGYN